MTTGPEGTQNSPSWLKRAFTSEDMMQTSSFTLNPTYVWSRQLLRNSHNCRAGKNITNLPQNKLNIKGLIVFDELLTLTPEFRGASPKLKLSINMYLKPEKKTLTHIMPAWNTVCFGSSHLWWDYKGKQSSSDPVDWRMKLGRIYLVFMLFIWWKSSLRIKIDDYTVKKHILFKIKHFFLG